MAQVLSGSFNTSAYSNRFLTLSWTATQDVANNQTTVKWTLKGAGSASGFYKAGNFKVVIAGETVYTSATRIDLYNGTTVASGSKVIKHNNDGAKSFTASAEAGIYTVAVNCSGSGSWELKSIPRKATLTTVSNFTDEASPTFYFSNLAGNAVDALEIALSWQSGVANIAYRSVGSKTATSYKFNFTDAERTALRASITSGSSRTIEVHLRTTIAGVQYWDVKQVTLSLVNYWPTITATVVDTGTSTAITGGDSNKIISGFNVINAKIVATGRKGANITKVWIRNGGTVAEGTTATFEKTFTNTTDGKFYFNAEDSRGNRIQNAPFEVSKTIIPWFRPTCDFSKQNMTTGGAYTIAASGTFYNGALGATANNITVQYRWRTTGGKWGSWTAMTVSKSGNNYTATASKSGLDYQTEYDVQIRAFDAVGAKDDNYSAYTKVETISATPVFDWGKSDFKHNTTVVFANDRYIYGLTKDGSWRNAFEPCNASGNAVLGWGGYNAQEGETRIYGDTVGIYSHKNVVINGTAMADFVVAQGTTDGWFYKKWNSGQAECYKLLDLTGVNCAEFSMNGVYYCGSKGATLPFTFTDIRYFSATGGSSNAMNFVRPFSQSSTQVTFIVCCFDSTMKSASVRVYLEVKGKWK